MDGSNQARQSRSVVGMVFYLCLSAMLVFFAIYLVQGNLDGGVKGFMRHGIRPGKTMLTTEIQLYQSIGFQTGWMNIPFLEKIRSVANPYFEIVDLLMLRTYGLLALTPFFVCIFPIAWFEGAVAYQEKKEEFDNISALGFHLSKKFIVVFFAIGFIFLVIPAGMIDCIPVVTSFSLFGIHFDFWITNPFNVLFLVGIPMATLIYYMSSNFTKGI